MKLNRLFESDERLRQLEKALESEPSDQELKHQYLQALMRSGVDVEEIAKDDQAILRCASYLENHILTHPLHERYLPLIQPIIKGLRESEGTFLEAEWNRLLSEFPRDNPRERDIVTQIVNLGDLVRSVHKPLGIQPKQ